MPVDDALTALEHDHDELTRDVRELAAIFTGPGLSATPPAHLASVLAELRDELVMHFVREEEGLFPSLARHVPDLSGAVDELIVLHDEIFAGATRLVYLARSSSRIESLVPVFRRFEAAYAKHVQTERRLLEEAARHLSPEQRDQLADAVRAL